MGKRRPADLEALPFYRARRAPSGEIAPWALEELEDFAAAHDDAFGGRVLADAAAPVALQIEATSAPPVWTVLDGRELERWAAGLARLWRRLGLAEGDTIAFFDYGSNPFVLLASSIYVAHLGRGAVERLGATPICNDGVASMTGRMLAILETVRPAAVVVRRDLVAPLVDMLATRGKPRSGRLRWAAVVEVEGAAPVAEAERLGAALEAPVRRLLRADAAFFTAADCAGCGLFHVDRALYDVRARGEDLTVTTRFAACCPTVAYRIGAGRLAGRGCASEPAAERIEWR
jgi:hypothetical protein